MVVLGRGSFSRVVEHPKNSSIAVKIIDADSQRPPHNWRAEIAALSCVSALPEASGKQFIVSMLQYKNEDKAFDHEVIIEMPRYNLTLENVIFHYAKASYPPGSGWRNVMPAPRVAEIARGLASALHAIHSAGMIHRDIKPENVLFTSTDSSPVLIDFGIAWVPSVSSATEPAGRRVTDVSTAEYKAPELLFGIAEYTEKVDIWALGCILARLLGPDCKPLFGPYRSDVALIGAQFQTLGVVDLKNCPTLDGHVAQSMVSHLSAEPHESQLRLGRLGPDNRVLEQIVHRMLDYEPSRRPAAAEIVQAVSTKTPLQPQ